MAYTSAVMGKRLQRVGIEAKQRLARGRPRSEASREAILSAAAELLIEGSLHELTIDAIAKRAAVSKVTIYRWWPTKAHVALEAVLQSLRRSVAPPDTGSTERDILLHLRSVVRFYNGPLGRTFRQLFAEGQNDAAFGRVFLDRFLQPRIDVVSSIWKRGVERGDVDPEIPVQIAVDLVSGPMIYRLMGGHRPLNDKQADALILAAFRGLGRKAPKPAPKKT